MQSLHDSARIGAGDYEQIFELQNAVLEKVAGEASKQEILNDLCHMYEKMVPGSVASIMMVNDNRLYVAAAPSLPREAIRELDGVIIGEKNGSCSNVILGKEPQYVSAITKDSRWENMLDLARQYHLNACWSVPVFMDGAVVGTFALTSLEEAEPSEFERMLLTIGARMVSIVLKREIQRKRDALLGRVFENVNEGIVVTDRNSFIVETNKAIEGMTGYTEVQTMGQSPLEFIDTQQKAPLKRLVLKALATQGVWRSEVRVRRADGSFSHEWVTASILNNSEGVREGFLYVISDINELKVSQEKLAHLAFHDPLTGLVNRPMLEERITHLVERSQRKRVDGALLFLDLDRFKYINDTFGHPAGDRMLVEVGVRLQSAVRKEDTVARFGGDEFVLLLESIHDRNTALQKAEALLDLLRTPFTFDGHSYRVLGSIGIALFPEDGGDAQSLLKHADTAMYEAKQTQEHIRFYLPQMSEDARKSLELEKELHEALEGDQFEVYYQPILKGGNASVLAAEALVRWRHPVRGMVMPTEFIPFAEETGVVARIDEWVLERVIADLRHWHADSANSVVPVSVNISGRHINSRDVTRLIQILNRSALARDFIGLELTETYLMHFAEETTTQLERLKHAGIKLAMDDFGTGYSSLGYLKRFKIDTLKIDRLLVRDIVDDPDDRSIADAIVKMGHSLQLSVIAEGVETQAQYEVLKAFGCDAVQGFYFDKALAPDRFERKYLRRSE